MIETEFALTDPVDSSTDLYKDDPKRTKDHMVLIERPFCSQTTPEALNNSFLTPTSALYVRNHAPVPSNLEFSTHEINFSRIGKISEEEQITILTLQDIINKFKSINVIAVLQCAGNRASESMKGGNLIYAFSLPISSKEYCQQSFQNVIVWSRIESNEFSEI